MNQKTRKLFAKIRKFLAVFAAVMVLMSCAVIPDRKSVV